MHLNIKNPETHALAHELAELTGNSMSSVVKQALVRELQRVRKQTPAPATADELLNIMRPVWQRLPADVHSSDHNQLYDADGLPL